jgi:hypothetical protein
MTTQSWNQPTRTYVILPAAAQNIGTNMPFSLMTFTQFGTDSGSARYKT